MVSNLVPLAGIEPTQDPRSKRGALSTELQGQWFTAPASIPGPLQGVMSPRSTRTFTRFSCSRRATRLSSSAHGFSSDRGPPASTFGGWSRTTHLAESNRAPPGTWDRPSPMMVPPLRFERSPAALQAAASTQVSLRGGSTPARERIGRGVFLQTKYPRPSPRAGYWAEGTGQQRSFWMRSNRCFHHSAFWQAVQELNPLYRGWNSACIRYTYDLKIWCSCPDSNRDNFRV